MNSGSSNGSLRWTGSAGRKWDGNNLISFYPVRNVQRHKVINSAVPTTPAQSSGGRRGFLTLPRRLIQTDPLPKTVTLVHFLHHRFVVGQHHCLKFTKIIKVGNQSSKGRIQGGDAGREVRLAGKESSYDFVGFQ